MASQKRKIIINSMITLMFIGILFINGNSDGVKAGTNEIYKNIEIFTEVLRQIEDSYVESRDSQELIYGAIKGMVQSLDPHSSFMTKEEYQDLMIDTKGSFSGVGIEITIKDNILTVVSPVEGTPAYEAGIKAGDRIIRIDNKPTNDMTLIDAVKLIRGPKGTEVNITVSREGTDKPLEFIITRDEIPLKSVKYYMLTPDIGYVRVSNFQGKTTDDLSKSLDAIENGREPKGLVLDLRNNPGGLLDQAIKVSDLFLDSGLIVSTKGRHPEQDIRELAEKNDKERYYPIVVLVNGGSASAAEIVAGALQDNKRALILGSKTFGKGSVQTVLPLSDGSGLRLTTARYYTPSGKSIQASGIIPDIELEFIPPSENGEDGTRRFLRERDLEGHMENEGQVKEPEKKEKDQDTEDVAKRILERDNQVRQAVQILQSWNVISHIKTGP